MPQPDSALAIIRSTAAACESPFEAVSSADFEKVAAEHKDIVFEPPLGSRPLLHPSHVLQNPHGPLLLTGLYSKTNASVAIRALELFLQLRKLPVNTTRLLKGIRLCSWPGRAQTMPIGPSGSSVVYIDGAHTGHSMHHCIHWYRAKVPMGSAAKHVLLFNCAHTRNPLELLLPLSTFLFSDVVLCPFDQEKPAPIGPSTPQQYLADFLEADVKPAVDLPKDIATFQQTLQYLYQVALKQPECVEKRKAFLGVPQQAALQAVPGDKGALPSENPTFHIMAHVKEAVAFIREQAASQEVHALVTGSLYLTGSVLRELGWKPE